MKKAVIYARFSSHGQTEQSIEGQLRTCNEYAERNNIVIVGTYIDRKKTGQNDSRPNFQRMLKDSDKKKWDYVIFYAIDRFARDDGDYGADKKYLRQNGVKMLSATEITGTNADGTENLGGILTEGVLVAVAKYYSRELSRKVKRGQFETLEKGNFLGGYMLYGYKAVEEKGKTGKRIEIEENEAEVVKKIFDLYASGQTAKDICDQLKEGQIKNRQGRDFCPNSIMNLLKNVKYTGLLNYGQYTKENYYPRIIDEETFVMVADRIDANRRSPARMKAYEIYRLSGKLFCGHCESLMTGESGTSKTGKIHHYYKCFGKKKHKNGCKKKTVQKDSLENLVVTLVLNHILAEDKILDTIENIVEVHNAELESTTEVKLLKQDLAQTEKYIANLMEAIKNGIFTNSTKDELVKLENQKQALEEQIIKEEAKKDNKLSKEKVLFFFKRFIHSEFDNDTAKTLIIDRLVEKVILYDNYIVVILKNGGQHLEGDLTELEDMCSNLTQSAPPMLLI